VSSVLKELDPATENWPLAWVAASPSIVQHVVTTDFCQFFRQQCLRCKGKHGGHMYHRVYSPIPPKHMEERMFQHLPDEGGLYKALCRRVQHFRTLITGTTSAFFAAGLAYDPKEMPLNANKALENFNS